MILEQLMLIPFTLMAVLYEIAWIDGTYALFFLTFVGILAGILFWKMKQLAEIFFKIKDIWEVKHDVSVQNHRYCLQDSI